MANLFFWERKLKFRLAKFRPLNNRNHIILQLCCLNRPLRPWNAPIVLGWKPTATALACGNTVREAQIQDPKFITIPTVKLVHLRKVKVRNITY